MINCFVNKCIDIEELQDFDEFENLEVLFLNDNKLQTIFGLEKNFRLRRLYLMVRELDKILMQRKIEENN